MAALCTHYHVKWCQEWFVSECKGPYPDCPIGRDIFQVNLQIHVLRGVLTLHSSVSTTYEVGKSHLLVYDNPSRGICISHDVPIIPPTRLVVLVGELFEYIPKVREVIQDTNTLRVLRNVVWSFLGQILRFQRTPSYDAFDIVVGTNKMLVTHVNGKCGG